MVQGLLALTALGLLEKDETLTEAAMAELVPYVDDKEFVHDITFIKATRASLAVRNRINIVTVLIRMCILQGDNAEAKRIYCKAIHRHPEKAALWRNFARHLITVEDNESKGRAKIASAAATKIAQANGDETHIVQVRFLD